MLNDKGNTFIVTDPNKDGKFGTKRDYARQSDIEGMHINVGDVNYCEPERQTLTLAFMTKDKRSYSISNVNTNQVQEFKDIWIDHPPQPPCYGCPGWELDQNYCAGYETLSERPVEQITIEHSCGITPNYCYGNIIISPFLYSPRDKRLRVMENITFDVHIAIEQTEAELQKALLNQQKEGIKTMLLRGKELDSIVMIDIKTVGEKQVYEVQGAKRRRVLFLIPVSVPIKITGSLPSNTDGEVQEKPWWSFFAW